MIDLPRLSSRFNRHSWTEVVFLVGLGLAVATPGQALPKSSGLPVFKVFLQKPGVYQLTFEALQEAGLTAPSIDSSRLALNQAGREIPIWVVDRGDGEFGAGDHIEFIGEHLSGHRSFYNEHTSVNVYRLEIDRADGLRMVAPTAPDAAGDLRPPKALIAREHAETDLFRLRFNGRRPEVPEPWYWQRLTHIDPEPFQHTFWLHRYQPTPSIPTSLKVHLQGWSTAGGDLPDHRAEVYLNGQQVGFGEWNGEKAYLIEIPQVPPDVLRTGKNLVEVRLPRRRPDPSSDSIIDEVILNWIELEYSRTPQVDGFQTRFHLREYGSQAPAQLVTQRGSKLQIFSTDGARYGADNTRVADVGELTRHAFRRPSEGSQLYAVPEGQMETPLAVTQVQPSGLKDRQRQADYIIITHPTLRQEIEPLADFHRDRGLEVTIVEVQDVYDEFNHSILDPAAIRDFLSFAYHEWRSPAPRFVLLVGDASWAGRAGGSGYGLEAQLPGKEKSQRNLIPAGFYEGGDGPAASDNFYVTVAGDDFLPDLAIGRLPVVDPQEVAGIVEKTLNYAASSRVGPWRRRMLWITDSNLSFQRETDSLADSMSHRGYVPFKIYPSTKGTHEQRHQALRAALGQGHVLVHFLGHGGRFVWRTGQTNFRQKDDLFGLEDLDQLAPAVQLPLVLSMTCYSAPFDHPTADSLGEKFLRLEGRGAVAVLAASWRVAPYTELSRALVEELTTQSTIGEAIVRAKHRTNARDLVSKYNLLGDPAIELGRPEHQLELTFEPADREVGTLATQVPRRLQSGRAIVDWLDDSAGIVHSQTMMLQDQRLEVALPQDTEFEAVASARVYIWDEEASTDAMGVLKLRPDIKETLASKQRQLSGRQ